jgi:hypothetical protein
MGLTPRQRTRARSIASELATIGPVLPGTVLRRETRCGRANCRCHAEPPQLHGPYWWWTRSVGGKTVTRMLSDEIYEDYRAYFEDQRRARELLGELESLALSALEADPRYGQRRGRGPTAPARVVDKPRSGPR